MTAIPCVQCDGATLGFHSGAQSGSARHMGDAGGGRLLRSFSAMWRAVMGLQGNKFLSLVYFFNLQCAHYHYQLRRNEVHMAL